MTVYPKEAKRRCVPRAEGFSEGRWEWESSFIRKRQAVEGIADGASKRDEKRRDGRDARVTVAKATKRDRKEGKGKRCGRH